ncbi:MAG: MATE family efflux transporter [Phycisphaeraceae bacterium]
MDEPDDQLNEQPVATHAGGAAVADDFVGEGATELTGRLAGLSLPRQVYVLAIWPLLEQLLNSLVSFVDMALAGRLSVAVADAVAVTGYIGWLMGMLLMGLGVGSTALIARAVGARHRRVASAAVGQSMLMAVVWGAAIGFGLWFGGPPIGRFFQLEGETLALASLYIRILAFAAPLAAVLFVGAACLRGAGDTRSPFFAMLAVNIVNVIASVLLVFGPAPIGGWGVAGIAMGTTLAWAVGAMCILYVLVSGRGGLRLHLHRLRPHWHTMRRIIRVGVPSLVESSGMWIGNAIVGRIVGGLGASGVLGAHMIAIRIESLGFLPAVAVGTAAATLVGQYLGAGRPDRARQAGYVCWGVGAGWMAAMGVVFILFPEALARLLAPDEPTLYEAAAPLLIIAGPVQVFFGTYMVLAHVLRGAGDTTTAMALTYGCTFLLRLPAAWVLAEPMGMGLVGVWLALCGELVIRGLVFAARFMHGGWMRVRV